MTTPHNGFGIVRSIIEQARAEVGGSLDSLTALSSPVDPYRLDTPMGHRNGAWLAKHMNKALGSTRRIHWCGLHYILVSGKKPVLKPNGEVYRNTNEDWSGFRGLAAKRRAGSAISRSIASPTTATPSRSSIIRQGLGPKPSSRSGSTSPFPTPTTSSRWRSRRGSR